MAGLGQPITLEEKDRLKQQLLESGGHRAGERRHRSGHGAVLGARPAKARLSTISLGLFDLLAGSLSGVLNDAGYARMTVILLAAWFCQDFRTPAGLQHGCCPQPQGTI